MFTKKQREELDKIFEEKLEANNKILIDQMTIIISAALKEERKHTIKLIKPLYKIHGLELE